MRQMQIEAAEADMSRLLAPKTPDATLPIMQLKSIFLLDPPGLSEINIEKKKRKVRVSL